MKVALGTLVIGDKNDKFNAIYIVNNDNTYNLSNMYIKGCKLTDIWGKSNFIHKENIIKESLLIKIPNEFQEKLFNIINSKCDETFKLAIELIKKFRNEQKKHN